MQKSIVKIIERETFLDERGFFREVIRVNDFTDGAFGMKQVNHSLSLPGVIRGLHAENWNKIVYPITGSSVSFFVDIRPDSETFGKVERVDFEEGSKKAIFVPKGVANSICVVGDEPVNYLYIVDSYYTGEDTTAVAYDDPDLNIKWPIDNPIISERDKNNPKLRDLFPKKFK